MERKIRSPQPSEESWWRRELYNFDFMRKIWENKI